MRKIKEVLRLHFGCKLSNKKISESVGIPKTSVFNCLERFKNSGLEWPLGEEMTEEDIEGRLYFSAKEAPTSLLPDFVLPQLKKRQENMGHLKYLNRPGMPIHRL